MDWNPLTWTFATTFFGVSLLKWGLVIGGIIFLALLRKFLLASVRNPPRDTTETRTSSAHAHAEKKTIASVATHEINTTPISTSIPAAPKNVEMTTPNTIAVKEFKQAVVVAKQKRKSPAKKIKVKTATAKIIPIKKIPVQNKILVTPPAEAKIIPTPKPVAQAQPRAKPVVNIKTEGIVITASTAAERKVDAKASITIIPPASASQKIKSIPAAPTSAKKVVAKKKIEKKKKIMPEATSAKSQMIVVSSAANTTTSTPTKKELAPAKEIVAQPPITKNNSNAEKKTASKKKSTKKASVTPTKVILPQKVSQPETKPQPKVVSDKPIAVTGKPVRMRNPGFI